MAATKAPPLTVLENFYDVSEAAIRLGLRKPDEPGKKGEKWLRDGVNRPEDGSKGEPFPCTRMAGQLQFSESQLAYIANMHVNAPETRGRRKTVRKRPAARPARVAA